MGFLKGHDGPFVKSVSAHSLILDDHQELSRHCKSSRVSASREESMDRFESGISTSPNRSSNAIRSHSPLPPLPLVHNTSKAYCSAKRIRRTSSEWVRIADCWVVERFEMMELCEKRLVLGERARALLVSRLLMGIRRASRVCTLMGIASSVSHFSIENAL